MLQRQVELAAESGRSRMFGSDRDCVKTPKFFIANEKFPTLKNSMTENFRIFPPRLQKLRLQLTDCPSEKFGREFLHSLDPKQTFKLRVSATICSR